LTKVKLKTDESGHDYLVPNELADAFDIDSEDEEMCDSGDFDEKWGGFRVGGCVNNIQLYIDLNKLKQ